MEALQVSLGTVVTEQCSEHVYTQHLQAGHPEVKATSRSQVFPQIQALGFSSSTSAEGAGGCFQDARMNHNGGTHQDTGSFLRGCPGVAHGASSWLK